MPKDVKDLDKGRKEGAKSRTEQAEKRVKNANNHFLLILQHPPSSTGPKGSFPGTTDNFVLQ